MGPLLLNVLEKPVKDAGDKLRLKSQAKALGRGKAGREVSACPAWDSKTSRESRAGASGS